MESYSNFTKFWEIMYKFVIVSKSKQCLDMLTNKEYVQHLAYGWKRIESNIYLFKKIFNSQ